MGRLVVSVAAKSVDLTVEQMTAIVGLSPDRSGSIGDRSRGPVVLPRHNSWAVEVFPEQGTHLGETFDALLERLVPFAAGLSDLSGQASLQVSVYGYFDDETGDNFNLSFSAQQLSFLVSIGAEIDVSVSSSTARWLPGTDEK